MIISTGIVLFPQSYSQDRRFIRQSDCKVKYPNWAQVFENDPSSESYDKNAEAVGNLTSDSLMVEECISNIKKEPSLMYLTIEPITKDIQILHHVTAIGGNIAQPDNTIVAFSGLTSSPLSVRLDPDIFVPTEEFRVPSWESMSAITDLASVAATTATNRNVVMKFRSIIAIPPLLTKTVIASTSKNPSQLMVEFITAFKAFDTVHAADADFPESLDACKRILYFLWDAVHNTIPSTISIPQSVGLVQQYRLDLEGKHILSATPAQPAASAVTGPSDTTLSALAGNIQNLTSRMETDSETKKADKEDKKDKFKKLPFSSQQTILFASSTSATMERSDPNPSFESFLLQSTLSRARTHLNQVLFLLRLPIQSHQHSSSIHHGRRSHLDQDLPHTRKFHHFSDGKAVKKSIDVPERLAQTPPTRV